jgi:hypothetical protein
MANQLYRCDGCRNERENCVQRRNGTWLCRPCIAEEWQKTKRRLIYRSELATTARKRLITARRRGSG